ncbi:unnamed protein product, partial [Closterium sp. NIES-53]
MHSRVLVSGLPSTLPPLPPSPAPPSLSCVEGRQRAAPHSSSFPPTTAPLQTLHMDVWGLARVSGQGRERYFLDEFTRYTTVFPLRSKGEVSDVLIHWIRTVRLQLRERFGTDLPVLCVHSERGGEFSSDLLRDFCRGEGILQSFTLPDSPQQNGIAERRIGLVVEVAPQPLAPCLLAGDLAHTALDGDGWRCVGVLVLPPHLVPWPPVLGRHVRRGPVPLGVSQVDPLSGTAPVQVAVGSGAAPGAASRGAASGGAASGGAEPSEGAESGGAAPRGAASFGGPAGPSPRLSSQQLREWLVRRAHCQSGAPRAGGLGDTGAGSTAVIAGAVDTRGTATTGPGGARTKGAGAAMTCGVGCVGAGDPTEPGAAGAGGAGAGGAGVGGTGTRGSGAAGARAIDPGAGGVGGTVQPRTYFVPLLQQVLGVPSSTGLPSPFLFPPLDQLQLPLQPPSPLPLLTLSSQAALQSIVSLRLVLSCL